MCKFLKLIIRETANTEEGELAEAWGVSIEEKEPCIVGKVYWRCDVVMSDSGLLELRHGQLG